MDIFAILSLIGGLALFLYGMNVMGDGLTKVSGGKLEKILEKLTSNPIKAVLLGAGVTAVIQSSSATTVMVVGFVNSGIMKLSQAVGIIMGANVGTTITSWILSLSGIESSSFFIQMLKPTSFSPILAIIGLLLMMSSKNDKHKDVGSILLGFAVLMFGMNAMSAAVEPLKDVPQFTHLLTMFTNPILGMLAGLILTAIIQSSSASVGILQALCSTGAVSFGCAIPIIMGQNIGTCVTAIISSIGASKNAKRTALVHLYFNIIGTALFMIVFYSINAFVHFDFLGDAATPAGIAVVHSIFNIAATLVLLPFAKVLEKLAYMSIKEDHTERKHGVQESEEELKKLDVRFLEQPGLAISHCMEATAYMAHMSEAALVDALGLMDQYDEEKAATVETLENRIDHFEDKIGSYVIQITNRNMLENDSAKMSVILHSINDLERISDHAVNLKESAQEMKEKGLKMSFEGSSEIMYLRRAVTDLVNLTVQALSNNDKELAREIEPLEEVIDDLSDELKRRHVIRLKEGKCTIEMGFVLTDMTTSLERIADHCSNIGVSILESSEEDMGRHAYLHSVKKEDTENFQDRYEHYRELYFFG
ncbi:Na/Pi cotransporter [Eubacterium ramulus]|uniref:Na/Pi cotransporter n=1 Tax=Eubacterium ramulus TaxID=39490 RepID=A0A2V1JV18_EUBRA|nr:Na/Pi cotransporter family protein [Eubacterium ramulus]PWE87253.1 Na/Pi cotransporter [Eubacterium ramulus]